LSRSNAAATRISLICSAVTVTELIWLSAWIAGVADPRPGCCPSAVSGHAARNCGRLLRCGISVGLMPALGLGCAKTQTCCGAVEWCSQASGVLSFSREVHLSALTGAVA
jgi:hypothetical protein